MGSRRFDVQKGILLDNNMKLMYVSSSRYDTDWLSIPHTHSCTELFYCVRGVGQFVIDNVSHPVGSDDFIIVNANVEHTEVSFPTNPLEYIVLGIDGAEFTLPGHGENSWMTMNFSQSPENILPYLRDLMRELEECANDYETICRRLMDIIIIKIIRQNNCILNMVGAEAVNKECAEIKRYIDLHYRESLTLEQLAGLVHINKYYLSHSFSKAYNCSPINYMLSLRIGESKYMLTKTNHSISRISQILGFSSPSYFTQSFKKSVGISPNEYRNQNK